MNINDAILLATGGPTVNEGLANWFSKTADENLMDAEARWLIEAGMTPASIADMWMEYLSCSLSLADCQALYWGTIANNTAIQFVSGQTNGAGTIVTLEFNGAIAGTRLVTDFTFAPVKTVSDVKIIGVATLQLTVTVPFAAIDTITCSYTDTQALNIDNFALQPITNNVT